MNGFKKRLMEYYYSAMWVNAYAPPALKKNFRTSTESGDAKLTAILTEKYFDKLPAEYLDGKDGKKDMHDHMYGRLNHFRTSYIPFIDHNQKLNGARILEIGGGTGCSTLALAEQGADVQSIDLDPEAQEISKLRLANCDCQATYHVLNATEIDKSFRKNEFDIIIYFAALEHMTYHERITSLKKSWDVLKPGGKLFILEAPNRLWFFDVHTSFMPFYFWLQDDIALDYAKFSERQIFKEAAANNMDHTTFMRWGRGVSFHELEISIGRHPSLKNAVGLFDFQMRGQALKHLLYRFNLDFKFKKILRKLAPDHIGAPFLEPFLDLALIKTSNE